MKKYAALLLCFLFILACKKEEPLVVESGPEETIVYPDTIGTYIGSWASEYWYYSDFMDDEEPPHSGTIHDTGEIRMHLVQIDEDVYRIISIEGSPENNFRDFEINDSLSFRIEEYGDGCGFYFEGHFGNEGMETLFFETFNAYNDSDGLSYEDSESKKITYSLNKE